MRELSIIFISIVVAIAAASVGFAIIPFHPWIGIVGMFAIVLLSASAIGVLTNGREDLTARNCTREQPHDGPCNGYPCAYVRLKLRAGWLERRIYELERQNAGRTVGARAPKVDLGDPPTTSRPQSVTQ